MDAHEVPGIYPTTFGPQKPMKKIQQFLHPQNMAFITPNDGCWVPCHGKSYSNVSGPLRAS